MVWTLRNSFFAMAPVVLPCPINASTSNSRSDRFSTGDLPGSAIPPIWLLRIRSVISGLKYVFPSSTVRIALINVSRAVCLLRYPIAPACKDLSAYTASSYMEMTSIFVVELRSRSRLMRSIPCPVFSDMSTITKSGQSSLIRCSAGSTSSASPHTASPGSWEICVAIPSRIIGWSSTIKILAVCDLLFLLLGVPFFIVNSSSKDFACQQSSAVFNRCNTQFATDKPSAISHRLKPHLRLCLL